MRYAHMLAVAAFVVAAGFLTSEAFAQWSDGGPEQFPLTYPPETSMVERESRVTDVAVNAVQTFDALAQWSDGGAEQFPLTYPPETVTVETGSRGIDAPCDTVRTFEALAQWSDGGAEQFPLTYPPEAAVTDGEICLAKKSEMPEDAASGRLAMR